MSGETIVRLTKPMRDALELAVSHPRRRALPAHPFALRALEDEHDDGYGVSLSQIAARRRDLE